MKNHIPIIIAICLTVSCESSDRSFDQIVSDAEATAAKRKVGNVAGKCNDPNNSKETIDTFNAMKVAVGAADCNELASNLVGLQEISLSDSNIVDLTPLLAMESLSILDLSNNHITDLSPLSQIETLSSLNLNDNDVSDLTPIKNLITLSSLSLARNQIVDVSPIGTLFNLLSLDLSNNSIESLANLGKLNKLVEFKMRDNILGTTLEKVPENCPLELESAALVREFCKTRNQVRTFMSYCLNYEKEPADIQLTLDRLKTFQDCEETFDRLSTSLSVDLSVKVDGNFIVTEPSLRITNISPLAEFTNIENLNLNFNTITDVEPISYITNLKSLKIRGNGFSDISSFSFLRNLITLDAAINRISDVSPIRELPNITVLIFDLNEISDITTLVDFRHLIGLTLQDNQITDLSPINKLPAISVLDVSFNNVRDFSPISNLTVMTQFISECNQIGRVVAASATNCPNGDNVGNAFRAECNRLIALTPVELEGLDTSFCPAVEGVFNGIRQRLFPVIN